MEKINLEDFNKIILNSNNYGAVEEKATSQDKILAEKVNEIISYLNAKEE